MTTSFVGKQLPDSTMRHVGALGTTATIVQLSTGFCAPCRAARNVLALVATTTPGVVHTDINISSYPDQAETFEVTTTPTTVIADDAGTIRHIITGVPKLAEVRALLPNLRTAG